jgi:hypothetical protein
LAPNRESELSLREIPELLFRGTRSCAVSANAGLLHLHCIRLIPGPKAIVRIGSAHKPVLVFRLRENAML